MAYKSSDRSHAMSGTKPARSRVDKRPAKAMVLKLKNCPAEATRNLEESNFQPQIIGTLSFPLNKGKTPKYDNTRAIVEIIKKRKSALLLCAGISVPGCNSLPSIIEATQHVRTVVVLETHDRRINYRIEGKKLFALGEQFFAKSVEATGDKLACLESALDNRSFRVLGRQALLLICGECMVVECPRGKKCRLRLKVPKNTKARINGPNAMVLNPTHTRMVRGADKRSKFLSRNNRVYVNASNWVVPMQRRVPTLHRVCYNGIEIWPTYELENESLCYREWQIP